MRLISAFIAGASVVACSSERFPDPPDIIACTNDNHLVTVHVNPEISVDDDAPVTAPPEQINSVMSYTLNATLRQDLIVIAGNQSASEITGNNLEDFTEIIDSTNDIFHRSAQREFGEGVSASFTYSGFAVSDEPHGECPDLNDWIPPYNR